MNELKNAAIEEANGGYVVYINGKTHIATNLNTNLNKAIKLIKDYLGGSDSE